MNLRVRRVTGCSLSAMLTYLIEGSESLPTMNVSGQMSEWWLSMKITVDWSRAASKFKFLEMKKIRLIRTGRTKKRTHEFLRKGFLP
jgi:hypothetical protein